MPAGSRLPGDAAAALSLKQDQVADSLHRAQSLFLDCQHIQCMLKSKQEMYTASNRIAYQSISMTDCASICEAEGLLCTPIIGFDLKGGLNMKVTCGKNMKYMSGFQFNRASSILFCVWMERDATNHLRGLNYQATRHIHNPLAFM